VFTFCFLLYYIMLWHMELEPLVTVSYSRWLWQLFSMKSHDVTAMVRRGYNPAFVLNAKVPGAGDIRPTALRSVGIRALYKSVRLKREERTADSGRKFVPVSQSRFIRLT